MKINVKVCVGTPCHLMGSQELIKNLKRFKRMKNVALEIEAVTCLGHCNKAPAVEVNGEIYAPITSNDLINLIKAKLEEESV